MKFALFVLVPLTVLVPLRAQAQAQENVVPRYTSRCSSCSATGLENDAFARFETHVRAVDRTDAATVMFERQRRAASVGVSGVVVGAAVFATGFLISPWECTSADRFPVEGEPRVGTCQPTAASLGLMGAGAALVASGAVSYFAMRPSEPEAVSAINDFDARHPARPFVMRPEDLPPEEQWRIAGSPREPNSPSFASRFLRPQITAPLVLGIAGVVGASYALRDAATHHTRLQTGQFESRSELREIASAGANSQNLGRALLAGSAVAIGAGTFFLFRPDGQEPVAVTVGPGAVALEGTFP